MVRMVHTNNFYEISLQISDPNIEFSTKTDIFEKWPCPKFLEMHFLARKKPLRGASTAKQRFSTYSGIFPSHSEPNLISKSFNNRIKPEIKPKKAIYQCNIPVGGPKTAMDLAFHEGDRQCKTGKLSEREKLDIDSCTGPFQACLCK